MVAVNPAKGECSMFHSLLVQLPQEALSCCNYSEAQTVQKLEGGSFLLAVVEHPQQTLLGRVACSCL